MRIVNAAEDDRSSVAAIFATVRDTGANARRPGSPRCISDRLKHRPIEGDADRVGYILGGHGPAGGAARTDAGSPRWSALGARRTASAGERRGWALRAPVRRRAQLQSVQISGAARSACNDLDL